MRAAVSLINLGCSSNFDLSVSLTCHCEERSDAAISLYRYLLNEIATPSARDDNVIDKPQFSKQKTSNMFTNRKKCGIIILRHKLNNIGTIDIFSFRRYILFCVHIFYISNLTKCKFQVCRKCVDVPTFSLCRSNRSLRFCARASVCALFNFKGGALL